MKSLKDFLFERLIFESNERLFGNDKFSIYGGNHSKERQSTRMIPTNKIINAFIDGYELIEDAIKERRIIIYKEKSNDFILVDRRLSDRNCLCFVCFIKNDNSNKIKFIIKTVWRGDDFKGLKDRSQVKIYLDKQ